MGSVMGAAGGPGGNAGGWGRLLATVVHPPWCNQDFCEVDPERDGGTMAFHRALTLDDYNNGVRHGLQVELIQCTHYAADGQVQSCETSAYLEVKDNRVEYHQLAAVGAAFTKAAELVGFAQAADAPDSRAEQYET